MAANEVKIKITGDSKQAQSAVKNVQGSLKGLLGQVGLVKIGFAAMGAAAVGFALSSVKSFIETGDEIQKMSLRTGFSTVALSELRHAALIAGTDIKAFETSIRRSAKFLFDLDEGLTEAQRAFSRLSLSVDQFRGLSIEESFFLLAGAVGDLEDQTVKLALAQEVFGRAGARLLPLIAEGTEGLTRLRAEAHELGIVFTQEMADAAAETVDNLSRLSAAWRGLQFQLAEVLIPTLNVVTVTLTKVLVAVRGIRGALTPVRELLRDFENAFIHSINVVIRFGNALRGLRNLTIGKLPGFEEQSLIPTIPTFESGGVVPGPIGTPRLIMAHAGERIISNQSRAAPASQTTMASASTGTTNIHLHVGAMLGTERDARAFVQLISNRLREETRLGR